MRSSFVRRAWRGSVLALSLAALAGCSLFSNRNPRYDPAPLTEYTAGISAHIVWTAALGSGGGYGFAPVVVGDSVYAAAANGAVARLELTSGRIQWQGNAKTSLTAGVGSDGQVTAVAATDGSVIAFDSQGKEKWRAHATSQVDIPPTVGAGIVAVRSSDYRIQAFDENTGEPLWSVQRPGPALALKTNMRMIIVEGLLIAGLPNGKILAINARTGHIQWEAAVSVPKGAGDLDRISDVVGAPQTQGSLLCAVAYQGNMKCFDVSQGGRPVWDQRFSSATGMTTDSQQAYAANQSSEEFAFSLADGHQVWKQSGLRYRRLSAPAVTPQALAVGDYQGYVHFLSRTDGHLLGRLQVGSDPITSPLVATRLGVLVQTANGNLTLVGVN
ncbi:MAG: outer membrane protein assembly factor BamB [Candidimonas sp.]|nr:MAG: outer membrane protein assembly factor BamB [Candidimonas sp.]TAM22962.1 MAG: outer membrane protein assembly factor BamB [Candidimonas sp.]TAM77590.1 MAG: outer membrane protein assembly factor BamB [Candidimonas sp.]